MLTYAFLVCNRSIIHIIKTANPRSHVDSLYTGQVSDYVSLIIATYCCFKIILLLRIPSRISQSLL